MRYHRLKKRTFRLRPICTALFYYKKALRLDRKLKDVRERIKILEKERKK